MILGTGLLINIAWPRGEDVWYNKWSGSSSSPGTLLVAAIYYLISGRASRERIDQHLPHAAEFGEAGERVREPSAVPAGVVAKG